MSSTYWGDVDKVDCPFDGGIAVSINDLMWSDTAGSLTLQNGDTSAQGHAYPASQMPDQSSEAANQAYFGPRFLGVAKEAMSASQERNTILVGRVYVGPMTIASGTYYQGDMLAATEASSGTALEDAKVKKTTTAADAIGYILKDSGGAVTTVTVCLISRVLPLYSLALQVLNTAGITMDDGANIVANTTTGTKIGTGATQKLGFWNATPVVQPSGAGQAAIVKTVAVANMTIGAAINAATASNSAAAEAWGFNTNAAFNTAVAFLNAARVDILALNTQLAATVTDITAINTLVNALQAALLAAGIIKGSA
ncbi:MAG: hypothetical protein WC378_00070 [Opitutaceae bacterium]|jgi:hypothetical protein